LEAKSFYVACLMAVATGPCPNCGAAIEFRAGSSISLVCKFCKHVVVRTDRDFRNLGRVADVVFSDAALCPGDAGTFRGRSFRVEGRLVLRHPQGGTWEEYYAIFDGRHPTWISEAQGFWSVVSADGAQAPPPLASLRPGGHVALGARGTFVVVETNDGVLLSAEGELPFSAAPGQRRVFADLAGANGAWASIDYGNGTSAQVFVGVQGTFAEFQIRERGGDRPASAVSTKAITCGNCGAPLPILAAGTERAACVHCRAITDVALQQVVAKQEQSRETPSIKLGREGVLPLRDARGVSNASWTVLGYVERSTGALGSDEWFGWQEYLLYNVQHGYRWLVFDEGKFSFVTPLAAADIDASRAPVFVRLKELHYKKRNQQQARVDFVLGEFYWKVEVGETVWAEDFEHGNMVLSLEKSPTEVNWSHGVIVPVATIAAAFGYEPKSSAYGVPTTSAKISGLILVIVIIVILIFAMAACSACFGDSSGSSSGGLRGIGGSSSGGFGGK
jgi:hypothetical protein